MAGFATVVGKIRGDIDRGTDFDARIKQAIESAIQFYRARRFSFNQARVQLSISNEYESLSVNVMAIDYFKIIVGSVQVELDEENYILLNTRMRDVSLSAEPARYARVDGALRFYPPPDRSYSAEMHCLLDLMEISACASDSASNAWLTTGQELIRLHAAIEMLESYIDGPESIQKADRLRIRESQVDNELKRRNTLASSSGKIQGTM